MAKTTPGRTLRETRTAAGVSLDYAAAYTQIKLGKSMGISREQIRKMEANLVAPRDWNAAALIVLAECYGVSAERLMPEEVNKAGLAYLLDRRESISTLGLSGSGCIPVTAGQEHEYATAAGF